MTENEFRDRKVRPLLESLPNSYYFIKEALALRGIPDIIGVVNGRFFAWELKRSQKEAQKKTGRTALQDYILSKMKKAGGCARFVYPENLDDAFQELVKFSKNP